MFNATLLCSPSCKIYFGINLEFDYVFEYKYGIDKQINVWVEAINNITKYKDKTNQRMHQQTTTGGVTKNSTIAPAHMLKALQFILNG